MNDALTLKQQQIGQKWYLWFTSLNAISYGFLADNTLILYAIKNGADDFLVGLLTSFFFLTMPAMLVGKKIVGRLGAAKAYGISWILRNSSAAMMITVPFMTGRFGAAVGLGLLTLGSFGFFTFRSMGLTANTPVIGEITNKDNRGRYLSRVYFHFNLFLLMAMVMFIFLLQRHDDLRTFQLIIASGSLIGMVCAAIISRVPESKNSMISGRQPFGQVFAYLWGTPRIKKLFLAWTGVVVSIMLVNPFTMVALKNGYQISNDRALIFALFLLLGGIIGAALNRLMLDRVGPRPMINIYAAGILAVGFLWTFAPGKLFFIYPAFIFMMLGICRDGVMTALSHYFLTVVPIEKRVGVSMFIYMISGFIAGLNGMLLGGGLLKLLRFFLINGLNIYRLYFVVILLLLLPIFFFFVRRLEPVADWRIKDVLGIFVSFRDIRALFTLNRLEHENNIGKE